MTAMVLPGYREPNARHGTAALLQVSVHLQTTVMAPDAACHKANVWLSMNAGHLLLAENPELVLSEPLQWRFDVVRSVPRRERPGTVKRNMVGRMQMDAITGEVLNPETLIRELISSADALASSAA
jgi:hypothetical protein